MKTIDAAPIHTGCLHKAIQDFELTRACRDNEVGFFLIGQHLAQMARRLIRHIFPIVGRESAILISIRLPPLGVKVLQASVSIGEPVAISRLSAVCGRRQLRAATENA